MIAQAGGLTYNLPQRQFAQQQAQPALPEAQQQEGTPFDIPMGQDLAYVENLTNNYYTSYGRLKDFTETMWKDYGVDVTKPDFAQPGGGLMHDTFLRMDADLRMAANDLAQEKKIREEQRKAVLEGKAIYAPGYREEAQLARTLAPMEKVIPKDYLYPEVEEAVKGVLNKVYNTPSESAAAFETVKPLITRFQELKKNDPANSAIYDQQIRALNRMPTYSLPDAAFRPPSKTEGAAVSLLESLKKPVFDNLGFWTPERTQPKVVNGKATVIMRPEQDVNHGKIKIEVQQLGGKKTEVDTDLIVDFYYMQDGKVMAKYKSPADDPKYDKRMDNLTVSEQVRQNYNDTVYRDFLKASGDLVSPETGAVTKETFLPANELQLGEINKQNARLQAKQLESTLNSEKNKIKEDMSAEKDIVVNINGKDYRFKNHMFGPNYYLEGEMQTAAELTGIPSPATSGIKYNQMTPDDVYKLLEKVGYFDQLIQQSAPTMTPQSQVTAKKTVTQAQFEKAAKAEGAVTPAEIAAYRKELEEEGYIIQ